MNDFGFTFNDELGVDNKDKSSTIEREGVIIKEITALMMEDIEEGSYLSASLKWLTNNDYKIDKTVLGILPSFIINELKKEAYEENLVRPSNNPHMCFTSNDLFAEAFLNN